MSINHIRRRKAGLIGMLTLAALLLLAASVNYANASASPSQATGTQIIELETLASGLVAPLGVTHAGDGSALHLRR